MKYYLRHYCCWRLSLSLLIFSCSTEENRSFRDLQSQSSDSTVATSITIDDLSTIRLEKDEDESVVSSFAMSIGSNESLNLNGDQDTWTVILEDAVQVNQVVSEELYLKVEPLLTEEIAGNVLHDLGCIYVELRDNVHFTEQTMIRIASTGFYGSEHTDISAPLLVKRQQWKEVPILDESLTLAIFAPDSIKKFNGELCFQLDLRDVPAQTYSGQIVVQYLSSGEDSRGYDKDSPADDQVFTCDGEAKLLRAGQKASLNFQNNLNPDQFSAKLRGDDDYGSFGQLAVEDSELIYYAPDSVPNAKTVYVVATPYDDDVLPEYCEISF